jgi:DNA-binding NtrC family response regulator
VLPVVGGIVDKGHVLVVDDDLSVCRMVADALRQNGFEVTTASSVLDALEAVENKRPNLVILDLRMPVLTGGDFAFVLKRHNVTLPVVVMTGEHDASHWADEIGAVGFLRKPFKLTELFAIVERYAKVS